MKDVTNNDRFKNSRRKFLKNGAVASSAFLIPTFAFPFNSILLNYSEFQVTSFDIQKEITVLLRTKNSLKKATYYTNEQMAEELARNFITVSILEDYKDKNQKIDSSKFDLLRQEFSALALSDNIDLELAKQQAIKPVYPEFYVLGGKLVKDYSTNIGTAVVGTSSVAIRAIKNVNYGKLSRKGKKLSKKLFKELLEETAESFGEKTGELLAEKIFGEGKDLTNYDISRMNEICKKELYTLAEENANIKAILIENNIETQLGLEAINNDLEHLINELPEEFSWVVQYALDENYDKIKIYIRNELQKNSIETADIVIKSIINKEIEEAKKRREWQEYQGQLYIAKFLAFKVFDERTANQMAATADFAMQMGMLVAMGAGPWAIAAGCIMGYQNFNAIIGSRDEATPEQAMFDALKNIQETLKFITEQLTTIQENQQRLLNEIISIGDRLAYKIDYNAARISEYLINIEAKLEYAIESDLQIEKDNEYAKFNISIRNIRREIESSNKPRFGGFKGIDINSDIIYNHAIEVSAQQEFNGYVSIWNPQAINLSLKNAERLDLILAAIPAFIKRITGKEYYFGNSNESTIRKPLNPYEWAKATMTFAETLIHFPELAEYQNGVYLTQLKELKKVGELLRLDIARILNSENIDMAFEAYELAASKVINECVDRALKGAEEKFLLNISKDGQDQLYFHKQYLFGNQSIEGFSTSSNPKSRIKKVSEIPMPTITDSNPRKFRYDDTDKKFVLKTSSNLYMEPGNWQHIGDFYTDTEKNPIDIGEKMGFIELVPIQNPKFPMKLNTPKFDHNGMHFKANYDQICIKNRRMDGIDYPSLIDIQFLNDTNLKNKSAVNSETRFRFNTYKLILKGKPASKRTMGNRDYGWTIAQLEDLNSEEQCDSVSFWSNHLKETEFIEIRKDSFLSTKEVIEHIRKEVTVYYDNVMSFLNTQIPEEFSKINNTLADEYEAIASILQSYGALSYWNNSGSFTKANQIFKDPSQLFSTISLEKENVKFDPKYPLTLQGIYYLVLSEKYKPSIDDSISLVQHVKKQMLLVIKQNANNFRENYFIENEEKNFGIPEVNLALEMIKQVELRYGV